MDRKIDLRTTQRPAQRNKETTHGEGLPDMGYGVGRSSAPLSGVPERNREKWRSDNISRE